MITREEAFELITKNKYQELFSILKTKSVGEPEHLKMIILLESSYNQIKSSFILRIIKDSEYYDEMAKLRNRVFEVINMIFI
ncbi:MAG: hypothetical protein HC831_10210 [Chloroflexia bacterium]|nr:hypothetical protein [Chloroflexia bacterium]